MGGSSSGVWFFVAGPVPLKGAGLMAVLALLYPFRNRATSCPLVEQEQEFMCCGAQCSVSALLGSGAGGRGVEPLGQIGQCAARLEFLFGEPAFGAFEAFAVGVGERRVVEGW